MALAYLETNTGKTVNSSVIWLHGLGANGHDFHGMIPQLHLPTHMAIRFIFPHAPTRPVSINGGYAMPAWFDIFGLNETSKQDEVGIRKSQIQINDLIAQQIASGISSHRIILAGFSQGGALALYAALRYPQPLAGVIGLSTFLPLADSLEAEKQHANLPIFLGHGQQDPVVPFYLGEMSRTILQNANYPISWHSYQDLAHSVSQEEINDVSAWLQRVLA